jgi:hypothetical protein
MLTWRDAEEEAERVQMEVLWAPEQTMEDLWAIEEIELEDRTSLRSKLATVLVQMGVKLDPTAAESITADNAA